MPGPWVAACGRALVSLGFPQATPQPSPPRPLHLAMDRAVHAKLNMIANNWRWFFSLVFWFLRFARFRHYRVKLFKVSEIMTPLKITEPSIFLGKANTCQATTTHTDGFWRFLINFVRPENIHEKTKRLFGNGVGGICRNSEGTVEDEPWCTCKTWNSNSHTRTPELRHSHRFPSWFHENWQRANCILIILIITNVLLTD